jgi:hypothetical protein
MRAGEIQAITSGQIDLADFSLFRRFTLARQAKFHCYIVAPGLKLLQNRLFLCAQAGIR